ncbi:MAG: hypothetical protein WC238_01285 [Parcubacteria group bacterium]|jgi:hypothetical protein
MAEAGTSEVSGSSEGSKGMPVIMPISGTNLDLRRVNCSREDVRRIYGNRLVMVEILKENNIVSSEKCGGCDMCGNRIQ